MGSEHLSHKYRSMVIKNKKRNLTSRTKGRLKRIHGDSWKDYYTLITVREFLTLIGKPCYVCGSHLELKLVQPLPGDKYLTFDHIVSLHNGGRHEISNLAACCFDCNMQKGCDEFEPART